MINRLLLSILFVVTAFANADAFATRNDNFDNYSDELMQTITPSDISGAVVPSWRDNWFINVAGGASAFIGDPIGCEDLFGRVQPTLQISLGKWHTPAIGSRLVFQGLQWNGGELQSQNYRPIVIAESTSKLIHAVSFTELRFGHNKVGNLVNRLLIQFSLAEISTTQVCSLFEKDLDKSQCLPMVVLTLCRTTVDTSVAFDEQIGEDLVCHFTAY